LREGSWNDRRRFHSACISSENAQFTLCASHSSPVSGQEPSRCCVLSRQVWLQLAFCVLVSHRSDTGTADTQARMTSVHRHRGLLEAQSLATMWCIRYIAVYSSESNSDCFHAGLLLCLFFECEDRGKIFLRNVCCLSASYTSLFSRR
jgi:hypothetical protein